MCGGGVLDGMAKSGVGYAAGQAWDQQDIKKGF